MSPVSVSGYIVGDHLIVTVSSISKDGNKFIKNVQKDIKKINITKEDFDRKKKLYLKSYITDFDNIEDIEYNICDSILLDGKVNFNEYSDIMNMDYKTTISILKSITYDNTCVIRTIK